MKLSIAYAVRVDKGFEALADIPLNRFLDLLKDVGFDGIEPNVANPFIFDARAFLSTCRSRGIEVSALSTGLSYITYGYSLSSKNESVRSKALEFFRKYIEVAKILETERVVVGLARGKGGPDESLDTLLDSLRTLLDLAEREGVTILLEPLNRYETKLINNIEDFANVYESLGRPKRLKMLFDTYHMSMENPDLYEALLRAKKFIGYVHLAENNRFPPGMGMIDWLKFLALLKAVGYNDYVSIECLPKPTPEKSVLIGGSTIKRIISEL